MAEESDWMATLREIIEQMAESGVTELEVRRADLRLRLRRQTDEHATDPPGVLANAGGADPLPSGENGPEPHRVVAPLTGIYYAAPNPSAKPYVEVGDWVEESTVVGLIETMKVFNEVTAECQGRVVALLVQQGQLVQAGDSIVLVGTSAIPDFAGEVEQ